MKLNSDSWFVRNYLHIHYNKPLPRTLCEFIWVVCTSTILNAFILIFLGTICSVIIYGLYVWILFLFTGLTMADIENSGAMMVPFATIAVIASYAVLALIFYTSLRYIKYRDDISHKRRQTLGENSGKVVNPIMAFVEGVWDRITKKTCTMIEWVSPDDKSNN